MERENTNTSLTKSIASQEDGYLGERESKKASFFIGDPDAPPTKIIGPNDEEIFKDEIIVPPDGGWGWVICTAAFLSNMIVDGIIFSFGCMMKPIIDSSGKESSTVAWVGSLLAGFYLMAGPLVSALANRFGFRPVAIFGSFLGAAAFVASWFSCRNETNLTVLLIVYGVVGGIGFGMIYVPAVIAVGFYFEKKRALATGIAICGSGIGTFIFAPLTNFLVETFGWEKSLLFQAAIILCCALCGSLYKPLLPKQVVKDEDRRRASGVSNASPSPEGTPLLMRIKRARDMESWDSVNSFAVSNETLPDGSKSDKSRSEKLYNQARKASTHSLNTGNPLHVQQKRMSVPSMVASGDSQTNQQLLTIQRTHSTTRVKSFVGLPDLKEIGEEDEHVSEDSPQGSREMGAIPPGEDQPDKKEQPVITINGDIPNKEESTTINTQPEEKLNGNIPENKSFIDGNENTMMINRNNRSTVTMIGSSTLTVDEFNKSRILRVASRVTLNKPMYRDDIFYTGSMARIPEYKKNVDTVLTSVEWTAAVSTAPPGVSDEDPQGGCCSLNVLKKMLDFSLLLSPTFLLLAVTGGLTFLGFFVPFMYLSGMAQQAEIDKSSATFLIAVIGIANTVGRILCGWISDRPEVNALLINNGALTVGGLVTIIAPFLKSYPLLVIYACLFGFSIACFISLRSILLVELLGLNKLTNAFGLLLLFQGMAAMVGSPLAGFLFDLTGTYNMSFYVAGGLMLLSGVMCYPLNCVHKWEINKSENKDKLAISQEYS